MLEIYTIIIVFLLGLVAITSKKTWIPVIICLIIIRDLSLGSLVGGGTLKIGDIFIAFLFCFWILGDLFLKNSTRLIKTKLDLFIVLFLLVNILSLLWTTDLEFGILRALKLVRDFFFYIIIRELFIRDFWGSYKKTTISYAATGILLLVVYLCVVISSGGIADFLTLYQKKTLSSLDLGAFRARGTGLGFLLSGPAMWFMMAGIFTFGALILIPTRLIRSLAVVLVMLMLVSATVFTLGRVIFVMMLILLSLLLIGSLYVRSRTYIKAISTILIVLILAGFASGVGSLYTKRFNNAFKDGSWKERERYFQSAMEAFLQEPLCGIGAGSNYSWQMGYPKIIMKSRTVHSTYSLVLSEIGILGLSLFLVMIGLWVSYLWEGIRRFRDNPLLGDICMTLLAFSFSYLFYIIFVGEFEEFEPWFIMAVACAIRSINISAAAATNSVPAPECSSEAIQTA